MIDPLSKEFCPYRGLAHYDEDYAEFFVGRENDVEVVIANLYAAPLTLLYGESGVGKTSVLMAGVVPRLSAASGVAVAVFREWQRPDFAAALDAEVRRAVRVATPDAAELDSGLSFDELLARGARLVGGPVFLVFDQFEEYFLYHPEAVGATGFEAEFARAVNRRAVDANFLLCLREEGLSRLDRFHPRIPNLMSNPIRLERMDRATARRAIIEPLERFSQLRKEANLPGITIERALVEALLSEQVSFEQGGAGRTGGDGADTARDKEVPRIELPFLQLVLTRLWSAEGAPEAPVLRQETLQRMGGANGVVRAHLDAAMVRFTSEQRRVAAEIFRYLVTPSRTKIAHTVSDLAGMLEASRREAGEIEAVVWALSGPNLRILKRIEPLTAQGEDRYEIFHDALAPGVLDWRARLLAEQRLRRRLQQVGLACVLLIVATGLGLWYREVRQAAEATRQAAEAVRLLEVNQMASTQLAVVALSYLLTDPAQARELAGAALRTAPTETARNAWYRAWLSDRLLRTDTVSRYSVRSVAISNGGELLTSGSQDDTAKVWPAGGGTPMRLTGHRGWVRRVAFGPGDTLLVSASMDATARIWDVRGPSLLHVLPVGSAVMDAAFSPDGRYVVAVTEAGTRSVWEVATGRNRARRDASSRSITSVDVSPTGQAASGTMGGAVELWNLPSGEHVRWITGFRRSVFKVRYSPDGDRLAVVGDGNAMVYSVEGGEAPQLTLDGHTNTVFDVAWSRDGRYLATASRDRTVRIWEAETGDCLLVLHGHDDWVYGVSFSPDGRRLISGSGDGRVRMWRLDNLPVQVVAPGGGAITGRGSIGRSLRVENGAIRIRDGRTSQESSLRIPEDSVTAVGLTLDGGWLIGVGVQRFALWPAEGGPMQRSEPYYHPDRTPSVISSPDGRWLIATREDGGVEVYDLQFVPPLPD